jgi:hypothetical protein
LAAFDDVLSQVTVRLLMCANGKNPNSWKSKAPPNNLIEFGESAYRVWESHSAELTDWIRRHLLEDLSPEGTSSCLANFALKCRNR